jgi:predicted lipoprotein with Yx(FWY)xxD motif
MRRSLSRARLLAFALVAPCALVVVVSASAAAAQKPTVRVTTNAKLHKSILVTRKGLTLYSLSAETHGRFICNNSACLSLWKPLVVARGTRPTGTAKLATIRRPDGRLQVTYRGLPLYTFGDDRKPGDANGNGFKDVGTWRVATTSGKAAPPSPPSGGYYGG